MKKFISIMLVSVVIMFAIHKTVASVPKELQKITSPDGKITATISKKSGDIIIESNKTNPLTIDYEKHIEYGMSAFSADSRYLFVVIEKQGRGDVECRDFIENKSFIINLQNIIRTSDMFKTFSADNNVMELRDGIISVSDIDENSVASVSLAFNDQNNKNHSINVLIDLYNQQVVI